MTSLDKTQLRKHLRHARRGLSDSEQHAAAKSLQVNIAQLPAYQQAEHIALYLASDGEISPELLMESAWQQGKQCYLPVVEGGNQMSFALHQPMSRLQANQYGILEPMDCAPRIVASELDLVLLPLVGFDRQGGRLGMGGGYYDRAFGGLSPDAAKPRLYGLAHSLQELEQLALESWDIPLHGVLTEQEIISVK